MQCINCGVATQRLRRYLTSSLPAVLLMTLARWLTIEVPRDANICHPCYEMLSSEAANGGRLFGHTMVCVTCGRSLRRVRQHHTVERNDLMMQDLPISHPAFHHATNYVCHPCWIRHQRRTNQDLNRSTLHRLEPVPQAGGSSEPEPLAEAEPEPEPVIEPEPAPRRVPEPELNLPTYKRAANTSRHCVFDGCITEEQLHVIPAFIKKMLIIKYNFYIPRYTKVCDLHLNMNVWHLLLENNNMYSSFTADQIEDIISIAKSELPVFNFEKVSEMPNVLCHYWTGLTIVNFLNLFSILPALSFKRPKNALALYLAKLRTGESDRRLATLFDVSRPTLTAMLKKIREYLMHYLVPNYIGPSHINHTDIVNRNLSIPNAVFGNEQNRPAIAIFDGTYIYLQKSSNYLFQKKTYSLHKYDNLVKPFMIVSCDGHIIDVVGPYAATQTDAEIMNHLFEAEDSLYRQLFQPNDIFILDRGFRDAIPLLQRLGYQIHKPESLDHGQTQLSTEQANKSRKVTLCRWVVEVVNGRFKRDFKLFRQRFFNLATPHLMEDFKIAAALINKYHVLIEDSPNSDEIIQRVVRFMDQPNSLGIFVRENNLNRQRSMFLRVDGNLPQLEHFPILDYRQLILMALGPYQVKQARSYYGEHIRANGMYNIEVCPDLERVSHLGGSRPQLLRGRIKSRHIGQKIYYVYILYETEPTINHLDDILSYYCSCIVGNRTLGCCCHVMTVIWYLGWARHQNTLSSPATFLDNVLITLTAYE
ncbi:uncharacterized protein LOC118277412 [Spodoptera frugiperda]|uniref:Uncharacterized protein LOC118277412 n=1 Tax=Spodoptera frugiperda TaxID=7108 RepID=A0A9R0DG30_SPOFR|nr:uncharacterized protein LOC118277412 [Spodoptera frugiperda]